ncbi:MAG: hypothetical protein CSA50_08730 [Gammaproteobacteria bacterium]|nr:MAG: hypothetical protein CSA50_08730 [Gammaproteobacteria bacterium]
MPAVPLLMVILSMILLASSTTQAATSMNRVLADYAKDTCHDTLIAAADATIKNNPHRLLAMHAGSGPNQTLSFIAGIIEYKDRQSHALYALHRGEYGCSVAFKESFTFKSPCIRIREEVFSHWQLEGKLNEETLVLKNTRNPNRTAFLTDAADGSYCLVTRHHHFSR